jgi:hypothetical protein
MTTPLWEIMRQAYRESSGSVIDRLGGEVLPGPEKEEYAAMLLAIADEVERRGDLGLDLDPGETSDWLREEAKVAKL